MPMLRHFTLRLLAAHVPVLVLLPASQAILCPAGSQCAARCGNVLSGTSPDDLVCEERAFGSDPTGQLFAGCVECQRASTYHGGNESDVQAMLYNVRYALSYCVWGDIPARNPTVVDSPCITTKACGPFKDAVQYLNLSSRYDAFQYCAIWPAADEADFAGCFQCLRAAERFSMANFVIALQAGCLQKPAPGLFIGLDGQIFSETALRISSPSPTAAIDPAWFDNGPLNLGARVGIALGCIVGVLILLGCGIVWTGKRRRRAFLRALDAKGHKAPGGWPSAAASKRRLGDVGEAVGRPPRRAYVDRPVSERRLRGGDDTPALSRDRDYESSPSSRSGVGVEDLRPGGGVEAYEMHEVDASACVAVGESGSRRQEREGK